MAVVICPSCGRLNILGELAARGFACELCGHSVPIPDEFPKDTSPDPAPLARDRPLAPAPPPRGPGVYPVSRVCPNCGHAGYKSRRPERLVAFTWDRVCRECETRYTPPTPLWAAVVFLAVGFLFVVIGFGSIVLRLVSPGPEAALGVPAMACEGFLGVLGVLAVVQGFRALARPEKA